MAALGSRQPSPGDAAHGGNQPSASREGSAHGLLCYAQVVRDYSQDSNLSEELQQMVRRCGWVAPFLLLLAALFVQSAGLYVATCDYVRRIDEVSGAAVGLGAGELRTLESLALEDPAARLLRSSKLAQSLEGFLAPELCVDLLSSLVILIWLAWVVSSQDLRLWTRLLFAGSVLATLKGFLAWSTVFPDAAGTAGCKSRLGEDGLMYYRQLNLGESIGPLQALQDVLLLTVRGLWMMGRSAHQHICADTVFSTSTSSCALFSLGLYDAVREVCRHSELRPERRATVLSLTGVLLLVVILADLAMAVSSRQHYAIDVLLALPLTLLVYGNLDLPKVIFI
ncbi:unnamed protein product [Polarella glacialis]|uniref:Sphingomyelin synthase-like domain-containing protein n=1 Tax=Polarella glacialis TaxID=89957 RepID=A0A813K980_POLGL|nr:unnamed protein product [Polarella glacialis]